MLFLYLIKIIFMKAAESGDETRRKIKDSFNKEYQNLKEKINRLKTPEDMPGQAAENE